MPVPSEYAARRRALIRRHHPDVGGDAEVLAAELDALDREFAQRRAVVPPRVVANPPLRVRPTGRVRRLRRSATRAITRLRGRLPRSVPGSRRYFEI
ncbi:hypothetical protein [uncultured Williamsia sp.]|uniref:hypothetical protein n=1 Tax=uncultured Williamsia sp. TaxID=259311 RepID=UPI0026350185|nr:hypothetical protein [uncultured Williamsia sp.]